MSHNKKRFWLCVCFTVGMICGVFFINLLGDTYYKEELLWNTEIQQLIQEIDRKKFFWYLLEWRGKIFLFIWLCGFTFLGVPVLVLVYWGLGMSFGIVLTLTLVQMKISGIILFLASIMPQSIFYIPVIWMLAEQKTGRETVSKQLSQFFNITVCIVAGVVLESNVNTMLLEWTIKKIL